MSKGLLWLICTVARRRSVVVVGYFTSLRSFYITPLIGVVHRFGVTVIWWFFLRRWSNVVVFGDFNIDGRLSRRGCWCGLW